MAMDNFNPNLEDASQVEVWVIYFPAIRKSLIVDTRNNNLDRPMVKVVGMVNSIEERIESIRQMRPRFPRVEKIVFVPLPLDVASIERSVLWSKVTEKFVEAGDRESLTACESSLAELGELEREVKQNHNNRGAVMGGLGFETIWERSR
jgi:hypothetical protein